MFCSCDNDNYYSFASFLFKKLIYYANNKGVRNAQYKYRPYKAKEYREFLKLKRKSVFVYYNLNEREKQETGQNQIKLEINRNDFINLIKSIGDIDIYLKNINKIFIDNEEDKDENEYKILTEKQILDYLKKQDSEWTSYKIYRCLNILKNKNKILVKRKQSGEDAGQHCYYIINTTKQQVKKPKHNLKLSYQESKQRYKNYCNIYLNAIKSLQKQKQKQQERQKQEQEQKQNQQEQKQINYYDFINTTEQDYLSLLKKEVVKLKETDYLKLDNTKQQADNANIIDYKEVV
ncbi:MAG: hypothetical protein Ta2D_07700 [Rickettsiales bacterium]|nr:MAG: hypothetical protein Ta2D_07700 [Rickettsiales bacterium]